MILIERDQTCNEPKHKKAIIRTNMFEKQFHRADSIFMAKLREVSEQAAKLTDEQLKINQR